MARKSRVMVLALDAADPGLVRELASSGQMPAIAGLLRDGAALDTRAPAGVFVSANWPTLFTATAPDRHRYLCWEEIAGGTYEHRLTDPKWVTGTPFWERLSDAGCRVAVLDVPHSIVRPVNGVMLAEWGCHDRHFGTASWPSELAQQLTARHGAHFGSTEPPGFDQFAPCDYVHRAGHVRTATENEELFRALCDGIDRKRAASLELLDAGGWDLFLSVLGESHCAGHQLWHLHDPGHRHHDPALAARLHGDPVREVYRRLDGVVAAHLERLGPEDTVYVAMPHGMTAHNDGTHLFDYLLARLEWGLDEPGGLGGFTRAAGEAARLVPRPLRGAALRSAAPLLRARTGNAPPADPPPRAERRWFATPNNTVVGAVRLNLAGREPNGRIHPDDRREVLDWLAERLTELVNVDTGGRVVRACTIVDDVYRRTPDDALGDLFVEWERSAPIERVWSPAVGTVAVPYGHWRQGDHVREGLLLARGPGIAPGPRPGTYRTEDLGATFSAAAGVELPDADGRPIASVLPGAGPAPAATRRAPRAARVRARLAGRLARAARRRVPPWARRPDPGIDGVRADLAVATARARNAQSDLAVTVPRIDRLDRLAAVGTTMAWLAHADVPSGALVSVVLPTRDRRALLEAAIASVQEQSYPHWELLVVDDGSADDTPAFLQRLDDPRIRTFRAEGGGVCAARNVALDAARGELVAYLDDDNRMDPHWLKAVVLTFAGFPDARACYGARVIDDEGRLFHGTTAGTAWVHFDPWDAEAVRADNRVDMNAIAHRRSDARFDADLAYYGDWDLLLQLTAGDPPVEVPAVAAYYRTDVPGRMSSTLAPEEIDREYRRVREKLSVE